MHTASPSAVALWNLDTLESLGVGFVGFEVVGKAWVSEDGTVHFAVLYSPLSTTERTHYIERVRTLSAEYKIQRWFSAGVCTAD